MRLIHRQRHDRRAKLPRIAISQAEITADLHYRGGPRRDQAAARRDAAR